MIIQLNKTTIDCEVIYFSDDKTTPSYHCTLILAVGYPFFVKAYEPKETFSGDVTQPVLQPLSYDPLLHSNHSRRAISVSHVFVTRLAYL